MRAVQSQIHSRGDGAAQVAIDGIFGSVTNQAVRAFQTLLGLPVDGIAGPQTWNHLVNGYLGAPDPVTSANDLFSAWEAGNRDRAAKNATPAAVTQIFAETFSPADGWTSRMHPLGRREPWPDRCCRRCRVRQVEKMPGLTPNICRCYVAHRRSGTHECAWSGRHR